LCLRCGDNPPFLAGMAKLNLQYILQKANKWEERKKDSRQPKPRNKVRGLVDTGQWTNLKSFPAMLFENPCPSYLVYIGKNHKQCARDFLCSCLATNRNSKIILPPIGNKCWWFCTNLVQNLY
jgi:hypothetical protein